MASAADEDHVIPTSVHFDDAENQKPAASNIASVAATPFLTTKSAVSATTTPSKYYTPMRPPSSPTHRSTAKKGKVKAVDLVTGKTTVEYYFDPSLIQKKGSSSSSTGFSTPTLQKKKKQFGAGSCNYPEDEAFFASKHLFVPCTIIKPLLDDDEEESTASSVRTMGQQPQQPYAGPTLVKTSGDGCLHRISDSTQLIPLRSPDDYQGLDDVLHLPSISEASLLHTLRLRYQRDDIYTRAGPILISVNPYKTITTSGMGLSDGQPGGSLYSEAIMLKYRNRHWSSQNNAPTVAAADGIGLEGPPHLFQIADRAYSALMESVHITTKTSSDGSAGVSGPGDSGVAVRNQSIIISGESGAGKTEATKIIMKYLARITRGSSPMDATHVNVESTMISPDGKRRIEALEDRVLSSNPLLETFGNAQTLRNDNSSRFGKFIHITFDSGVGGGKGKGGRIIGASVSNYLLETTRITHQVEGERNYHIFYQLLAGADDAMKHRLFGLDNGSVGDNNNNDSYSFHYLTHHQNLTEDANSDDDDDDDYSSTAARDRAAFAETRRCLSSIGLSDEDQEGLLQIAAAVLHIGNIQFEGDSSEDDCDKAKIKKESMPSLVKACELLGIDEERLEKAMLTKLLAIAGGHVTKHQNVSMAEDKRDALAKTTYSCLFLWLVQIVNDRLRETASGSKTKKSRKSLDRKSLEKKAAASGFIGVLDIYGFECFETNGFEQLLINYCNEKLQRHFNRHLFEVEQELYATEGVDWSYISFNDNRVCLELIEGKGDSVGILNTLDDAWGGMGTASEKDGKFIAQLHTKFGTVSGNHNGKTNNKKKKKKKKTPAEYETSGHPNFVTPKFGNDKHFIIKHYAGEVCYTADGFVEKNMETMSTELRDLGKDSTHAMAQKVYLCGSSSNQNGGAPQRSTIRGVSVGYQFRTSLQCLIAELEGTQPHYIRCIKPNPHKAPGALEAGEVLKQLRYSGMMEAIRIRREGYSLRENHESFYNRYNVLLSREELVDDDGSAGIENLVRVLSKRLKVGDADWQIGHSKIFLRKELSDKLEALARLRVRAACRTVGRFGRNSVQRKLSRFLVAWVRLRLHMLKYYRQHRAATKLAATERAWKQHRMYLTARRGVIRLQAEKRRRDAFERVRKIRDPYIDMTFKECQKLLLSVQSRLEKAVGNKNFRLAAELEVKVADVANAVEKKRPLTRAFLDKKIGLIQGELDDALARKSFDECAPLQEKLEELQRLRADLPTIDELREEVKAAEAAVALAVENRDFAGAEKGQNRINLAKKRLADTLEAEKDDSDDAVGGDAVQNVNHNNTHGIKSRAQLEEDIAETAFMIETAIGLNDFSKASSMQKNLEELESLRQFFPSRKELQSELEKVKSSMETAISNKDFGKAEEYNGIIIELESKIAAVKENDPDEPATEGKAAASITLSDGTEKVFESRADLEKEIKSVSSQVTKAVASKEFKKAESIQEELDKLTSLRVLLPSLAELQKQLQARRKELNEAISKKQFAKADELHQLVEDLESKVKIEQSLSPPETEAMQVKATPVKGVGKVPSVGGSARSKASAPIQFFTPKRPKDVRPTQGKTVEKLRPKKPIITRTSDSILSVAKYVTSKRGHASVVVGPDGDLAGIITDTDITRRVVAKSVDTSLTSVSEVMTPDPQCVSITDSAMEALSIMVENRFRHLPVLDSNGAVTGLLDIAKCLNDAISKLERSQEKKNSAAEDVVKQVVNQQTPGGTHAAAMQALLGNLMLQAFGDQSVPTLRTILAGKPSTVVTSGATIFDAGQIMAEHRKASLVVDDDGQLVGIFGFKDMMTRAVAKDLSLDSEVVSAVMTPNPEFVSPDTTILEALQVMHDNNFLTLPVCESDGSVVGVVDVMDVISGFSGTDGWKSMFSSAMDVDDMSDTSSVSELSKSIFNGASNQARGNSNLHVLQESVDERPVSKLRPSKPVIANSMDNILRTAQVLSRKRAAASLIVTPTGGLAGILTDTDITRRVVAKYIDPSSTSVSEVMTPNPMCVSMTDSATDALVTMVDNQFRHLPVTDSQGSIVGLLDIAKCLNSIISKLERSENNNSAATEDVVKQVVNQQGASGAHAEALNALLGSLMSHAFGNQSAPTLRSILAGKPSTVVTETTTILETGLLMAEHKKASLIVDSSGQLVGIFGFKDMMSRAVAKELSLDTEVVSTVMTPNPETVSPEATVLEALQTMADNKFLNLPVCEEDGRVLGIVDVMDVITGCGGADGWRSMFTSAFEATDDQSDTNSVNSFRSGCSGFSAGSGKKSVRRKSLTALPEERPVSKLRPSKPIITNSEDSILRVARAVVKKRGVASLIINEEGGLAGILTDTDITRRVVAKYVDPVSTCVCEVMTANPMCVSMTDSAMDALMTMVENRFRHLPVTDTEGSVVGLLDIAKCLNSIISKLERSEDKSSSAAEKVVQQVVTQQGAGEAQAAALHALLGNLMTQAFGNHSVPTMRTILAGRPATVVNPRTSIREAGVLMAEQRKASLVVDDDGHLVGIFGFKDMMSRALAKEVDLDSTSVSTVMTQDPETVSPDITVLEALQKMHDNKFLTLPVCEQNGSVLGIVDVMDVIYGCGGAEGWKSIFSSAMNMTDDVSDSASLLSQEKSQLSGNFGGSVRKSAAGNSLAGSRLPPSKNDDKTVSRLRPSKPIISNRDDSILFVAKLLQSRRGTASTIVSEQEGLVGILSATDITRRVVAKSIDPSSSCVSTVMTPSPTCVSLSDSATDALVTMVENRFRQLPVVDDEGSVVGLLDIARCLNDAITKLEQQQEKLEKDSGATEQAMKQMVSSGVSNGGAQAAALQALLASLMSQAFGNKSIPTLRTLLDGSTSAIVPPSASIRDTGKLMADHRKAALVVDSNGQLLGIFGFKDMMNRAVAKELPLESTEVSAVMTPDPEAVSPDITALEALQVMHDNKFLNLPVCEDDGRVVGLIDVMDVMHGCGGAEGWRSLFSSALDIDDDSVSQSGNSFVGDLPSTKTPFTSIKVRPDAPYISSSKPWGENIPATLEFSSVEDQSTIHGGVSKLNPDELSISMIGSEPMGTFKVTEESNKVHKIRCETKIDDLMNAVSKKTKIPLDWLHLHYVDEDGDDVTITSDEDVVEVWSNARKTGNKVAKLKALSVQPVASGPSPEVLAAIGVAAVVAFAGLFFLRPSDSGSRGRY